MSISFRRHAVKPLARFALAGSASALALMSSAAFAQAAPATAIADDEIIVTGSRPIAESEAAALAIQKNSDSLVSVLSSDAVGRLPDQNIAQAVSRLPGVGVERDQGQARYINLRGAPRNWTTLSFNGVNIVSPEGRDARFDSIPSAIASQVIVNKAVTPDMSGETISGNVDVITRSGLDQKGFRVSGKLGYGKGDLGNKDEVEAYLLVANQFETGMGDIGVLVSGSYYARGIATDNFETDWEQVSQDTRPGAADRFWARETERKFYRATRRNYSLTGRLDWRPDSDNRVYLESIYTAFTDAEQRDNYIFDLDDQQGSTATAAALALPCPATAPTQPPAGTTGYADACLNTPFAGTVYGVDINSNILIRRYVQSIFTNTIGGDHKFGDGWSLKWRGNYSRSLDDRSAPAQFNFDSDGFGTAAVRPTVQYDLTNNSNSFVQLFRTTVTGTQLTRGPAVGNIQEFALPLRRVRSLTANDTTKAYTARLEIGKETQFLGGDTKVRLGFQFDQRTKESLEFSIDRTLANGSADLATVTAAGIPVSIVPYATGGSYIGKIHPGYDFQYFNIDTLFAQGNTLNRTYAKTAVAPNFYHVTERIFTGYAMFNSKFDWGSIIGGVRYENVRNIGFANSSVTVGATTTTNLVSTKVTQSLFFPSLHVNFDLDETKKLRVGLTSGAARPDYDQLRPNLTVNDGNQTISGGNPAAKPERAYGIDAYFEWYLRPQGFVSVGLFYKRVDDVLFTTRRTFGLNTLNFGNVDRSQYAFSGLINGGSGYIYGAEAAVQLQLEPYTQTLGLPDWMGGFGISANATLNRSQVDKPTVFGVPTTVGGTVPILRAARKTRLPGTSDTVYNIGAYYEKYGLSVRAQYQWRSDYLDSVADLLVDGGDAYWRADGELDVSLRYELKKGFEVYVDASNLLNGPGARYTNDRRYTIEYEKFGRRFTGGVRVTF